MMGLLVTAAALLLAGHVPPPVEPATLRDPAFCAEQHQIRDFGISRLPPVKDIPPSGHSPFAPKTVSLETMHVDPVLRLGEAFGYDLFSENFNGHTPLHWNLRARIVSVNRSGRARHLIDHASAHVGVTNPGIQARLVLRPPRRLGFYRYDVEIFDRHGVELAAYSKYLRVVRKFWRPRLALNRRRFRPGQSVLSRPDNLGSVRTFYGESFDVQQRDGRHWVDDPALPDPDIWLAWAGIGSPGMAGRCSRLELPADLAPGRYRIVKYVGRIAGRSRRKGSNLVAPFEVVGHASVLARARARLLRIYRRGDGISVRG